MFSSKKKVKPVDVVKSARDAFGVLEKKGESNKAIEEISKNLSSMKTIIYGDGDREPNADAINSLVTEIHQHELVPLFVTYLDKLEFEAKKDVASIFNFVLRRQINNRYPFVEYLAANPKVMDMLIEGYSNQDIALGCGSMLRECIRHEELCKIILNRPTFYLFFQYVEITKFDIASDAFSTFKELLTQHKSICAQFLSDNYDKVFEAYTKLLNSTNFATKRLSIKLLGELLLDRAYFSIMTRYISIPANLKLMMNLLRNKSRSIQFEAFHVFKVFVANPKKPKPVLDILVKNKDRLISFLSNFHNDKDEEQFTDEKKYLIDQIQNL